MQDVLTGMRVIECSAFVAAPSGGMTLAQLGADVIRVDPIGGGIDYRRWPVTDNQDSLYWHSLNKGKRSLTVDLRHPEGRALVTNLIAAPGEDAGIFMTNFPARGWMAEENFRKHRTDLIYLNLTGDRHGGSALDYTVNCQVGLPFLNSAPGSDNEVANSALPAWDVIAGQHIAIGLLAAERHRRRTGEGQFVKLALADVALATVGHLGYIAEEMVNGCSRQRMGNHIYGTFGRDFVSSDGVRVMIVGVSAKQWRAIVEATGLADQIARLGQGLGLDFSHEGDRYVARKALAELLEPWFAKQNFEALASRLDAAKVCWGKYQTMAELVAGDVECSVENPLFSMVEQPGIGRWLVPDNPLGFSAAAKRPAMAAPALGQHTDEILADRLGLSSAEIGRLHDQQIVGGAEK